MTAKLVFEYALTELGKQNASPSLLLHDFNYFINKAINLTINKKYNIYDVSQQTTDDLRVLKATSVLKVSESDQHNDIKDLSAGVAKLFEGTYNVTLPSDYLHMLNCVCIYKVHGRWKCYDDGNDVMFAARRLTADSWSVIINDYYTRPLPWRPYYYINNVNTYNLVIAPTNPVTNLEFTKNTGTDATIDYKVNSYKGETGDASNLPRTIDLDKFTNNSMVEREAGVRYGNTSNVRMEIRYGRDNKTFELTHVQIDYIKAPQEIRLTQELVDLIEDTSQMMEFPDYMCHEIVNELIGLLMENSGNPRLQTHTVMTQSIANPALLQQLAPQQG